MNDDARCLLCGARWRVPLLPRSSPRHVVCLGCGFVFQSPLPDAQTMHHFYQEEFWERGGGADVEVPRGPASWSSRQLALAEWLRPHLGPGQRVIEVGCGGGYNLACLVEKTGCSALGIEPGRNESERARRNYGLDVLNLPLESVPEDLERATAVVLCHVLEHFQSPLDALARCRRLLGESGVLWVEVPNILRPHPSKSLKSWLALEHNYYFSRATLIRALELSGFEVIRVEEEGYVRALARVGGTRAPMSESANELLDVWRAIGQHEARYWPKKILARASRLLGR